MTYLTNKNNKTLFLAQNKGCLFIKCYKCRAKIDYLFTGSYEHLLIGGFQKELDVLKYRRKQNYSRHMWWSHTIW